MARKKTWFMVVLLLVFMPSALLAQEMMHGKWWHDKALAEELQLSDSERKVLEDKYTESRRRMIDLKSELEKERLELDIVLDRQDADKSLISEQYDRLEKARAKLSKERFGLLLEVRDIIGVERFQSMKELHRSKMRSRGDRHFKDRFSGRGRY